MIFFSRGIFIFFFLFSCAKNDHCKIELGHILEKKCIRKGESLPSKKYRFEQEGQHIYLDLNTHRVVSITYSPKEKEKRPMYWRQKWKKDHVNSSKKTIKGHHTKTNLTVLNNIKEKTEITLNDLSREVIRVKRYAD